MQTQRSIISDYAVTVSAGTSSACSILVGFPLDSLKTRLQSIRYPSVRDCILQTYRAEGLAGFYRGCVPLLFTASAVRSIAFNLYHFFKAPIIKGLPDNANGLSKVIFGSTAAGGLTGAIISISSPLEFIKVQRQLQKSNFNLHLAKLPLNTLWQWANYIYMVKGLRGFYYGYSAHASMDIIGTAFYFGIYETFKHVASSSVGRVDVMVSVVGGGLAGSLSWLVIYPLDVYMIF